jgi:hypothetical protein
MPELIQVRQGIREPKKYTRLGAHLARYGLTKRWLIRRTMIHQRTIHLYCKGLRKPNRVDMGLLTSVLGIPAEAIWDFDHPPDVPGEEPRQRVYTLEAKSP